MKICEKHKEELDQKGGKGAADTIQQLFDVLTTAHPENSLFNGLLQIRDKNGITQFISPGTILHLIYKLDKEGNSVETAPYLCLGEYNEKLYFLHAESIDMGLSIYLCGISKAYEKNIMDLETEKFEASMGMIKFGGSFTRSLGEALASADRQNAIKLRNTYREMWDRHRDLFRQFEKNQSQESSPTEPTDSEC